jgi:AcrR family transcriptional regulator
MTMRQDPADRKASILAAAVRISHSYGYHRITRANVAGAAQCSEALVSSYFGTMTQLRRAVLRTAIAQRDLVIVAQALAAKDPHVMKASQELRQTAALSIV